LRAAVLLPAPDDREGNFGVLFSLPFGPAFAEVEQHEQRRQCRDEADKDPGQAEVGIQFGG
jgi:hypothetical protein